MQMRHATRLLRVVGQAVGRQAAVDENAHRLARQLAPAWPVELHNLQQAGQGSRAIEAGLNKRHPRQHAR